MKKVITRMLMGATVFACVVSFSACAEQSPASTAQSASIPDSESPAFGNSDFYSVAQTEALPDSPLKGKTIIFLGSSVTAGSAAKGESFVDFMEKRNGIIPVKEALSGTTLVDSGDTSYISRMKTIDQSIKADVFVCQLSTNDATSFLPLGDVSADTDKDAFDTQTITGAMEYVIAYAKETWNCPVVFYTGTKFESVAYTAMVERLAHLQEKWDIGIIDLWNDAEMNAISDKEYDLYMGDKIHPSRAGYKNWWTPKFETSLTKLLRKDAK